jgi:hypothetical protein
MPSSMNKVALPVTLHFLKLIGFPNVPGGEVNPYIGRTGISIVRRHKPF